MREFGPEIWIENGPPITAIAGFHYPTRMVVIRLVGGGLFIWSPIPLTDGLRNTVTSLGVPRFIVAPSDMHHLHVGEWAQAFPEAQLFATQAVLVKRPDLAGAVPLGDKAPPGWAGQVDQVVVTSNRIAKEVVFFHRSSATVLFTDLLQQMPSDWYSGWRRVVACLDGMIGSRPAVPRKFRLALRPRAKAKAEIGKILGWRARNVIMAHGTPVEGDGQDFLKDTFRWLLP